MLTVGSLFSGIGGLDLGLERAGMIVRWQVEVDAYCTKVLAKHWPDVRRYGDITTIDWDDVECVDLVCGGFPCQPVSLAGRRAGTRDPRWFWPEFNRCVRALRPRYVVVENVPGLLVRGSGMGDVLGDLARCGYDCEWDCIPAAALGAPHLRYRVFLVGYARRGRRSGEPRRRAGAEPADGRPRLEAGRSGRLASAYRPVLDGQPERGSAAVADPDHRSIFGASIPRSECHSWAAEPDVGRVAHGVPARVDRLRALGNAVVPQVAEWIGRRIATHAAG
jgi:DNA (cytosine-5)-methyltransferase 1